MQCYKAYGVISVCFVVLTKALLRVCIHNIMHTVYYIRENVYVYTPSGTVGSGTAVQAGKTRVRFPMMT